MSSEGESLEASGEVQEDKEEAETSRSDHEEEDNEDDAGGDEAETHEDGFNEQDDVPYGWPDADTGRLIELWRDRPQLYDLSHKWYSNKHKKDGTLARMCSELNISGMFGTCNEI